MMLQRYTAIVRGSDQHSSYIMCRGPPHLLRYKDTTTLPNFVHQMSEYIKISAWDDEGCMETDRHLLLWACSWGSLVVVSNGALPVGVRLLVAKAISIGVCSAKTNIVYTYKLKKHMKSITHYTYIAKVTMTVIITHHPSSQGWTHRCIDSNSWSILTSTNTLQPTLYNQYERFILYHL